MHFNVALFYLASLATVWPPLGMASEPSDDVVSSMPRLTPNPCMHGTHIHTTLIQGSSGAAHTLWVLGLWALNRRAGRASLSACIVFHRGTIFVSTLLVGSWRHHDCNLGHVAAW